ncbi:hypothetical protein FACS189451_06040 [Bacteroidia bacterium]|nr:hypothetical protein FACS189446_3430 [Bacteroidia bacterium]GHT62223.1 hypothetical protein FACS189451_06040 [Bacteroidia bacterium]
MEFINFHIAYLLTKHERVIIPDFGAFVVSKVNDNPLKRRGFISPPVKYFLSFNPEMIQDDGLLVRSVEREKNIGYTEALRLVYEYVDSLVDNLRTGQTVQFSWIGKIHLSGDRKIVFTPAKNLSCNASNCGLVNLNFPYLNESSEEESVLENPQKIYEKPVFYIILAAIVLILALVFIFLVSKPFDKNLFSRPDTTPVISDTIKKANPVKPVINTLPAAQIDSVSSLKYFIIISSLPTEKEAEIMLNYFKAKGLDQSRIIHSDRKYRIAIETFTDQEKAVSFLNMLKKDGGNPLFKEAWIFEDKGQ